MSLNSTITKQQLVQRLIKTICLCFEGPDIDDTIQLQIIKVNYFGFILLYSKKNTFYFEKFIL